MSIGTGVLTGGSGILTVNGVTGGLELPLPPDIAAALADGIISASWTLFREVKI